MDMNDPVEVPVVSVPIRTPAVMDAIPRKRVWTKNPFFVHTLRITTAHRVEVPGIEPGSFVADSGLLRAQPAPTFYSAPALTQASR